MDAALRPGALIDRDGTIIREVEYLADPEGVELLPGAVAGLRSLEQAGYALVIVTNQSGIARGLYDEAAYRAVQARLLDLLHRDRVTIAGSYHCPHHPEFSGPCDCRKPAPGLFVRAGRELGLDLRRSILVGDRLRDIAAARALGARGFLVRTGYGATEAREAGPEVVVCDDLSDVARAAAAPSADR